MEHQNCGSYGQLPTHCGNCGARLPNELDRFFCPKCQALVPVSRQVTMTFETVEAGDGDGGVRVSVGDATKILFWDDFEDTAQLWYRVGKLVHYALVWGHTPDTVDQVEAERAAEIDALYLAEAGPIADPADLGDLPDF